MTTTSQRVSELRELADASQKSTDGWPLSSVRFYRKEIELLRKSIAALREYADLIEAAENGVTGLDEMTRTAPKEIWLQVGDDEDYKNEPFPVMHEETTWCHDSVVAAEVKYIRADLAVRPLALAGKEKVENPPEKLCPHGYPQTVRCSRCGD